MKSLIYLLLAVLVMSCAEEKPARYYSTSAEIDSLKALITAYEDGNWERWSTFYADTAKVYHNSVSSSSPAQMITGMQQTLSPLSRYGFKDKDQFHEMIVDDNGETWVNFWANWEGHLADPDTTLVIPVHLTAQFMNGKIVEEHAYYNMQPFAQLLESRQAQDSIP